MKISASQPDNDQPIIVEVRHQEDEEEDEEEEDEEEYISCVNPSELDGSRMAAWV